MTATWIGFALTAYWLHQRGGVRWRALLILAGYLGATYFLLGVGRGAVVGSIAALELRYLADATPVIVLTLGLLLLDVRRPTDSSSTPTVPQDPAARRTLLVQVGLCVALLAGAGLSTVQYVAFWHDDFDAKVYTRNVAAAAQPARPPRRGRMGACRRRQPAAHPRQLRLAGLPAPPPGPRGDVRHGPPGPRRGRHPPTCAGGARTGVPARTGQGLRLRRQGLRTDHRSRRTGRAQTRSSPHGGSRSTTSPAPTVRSAASFGDVEVRLPVLRGLHQFLARVEGPIDEVAFEGGDSGLVLCVDKVTVGKVQVWDEKQ